MKLLSTPVSPHARKARMLILERGVESDVEIHSLTHSDELSGQFAADPLARGAVLCLDNDYLICDHRLILDLIDERAGEGRPDWKLRNQAALADAVTDAACDIVCERRRPGDRQMQSVVDRHRKSLLANLTRLEGGPTILSWNVAGQFEVTLCCALGYLDFRLPEIEWRSGCPMLSAWYQVFSLRPAALATRPVTD